jgi:hypothetical protein
VAIDWTRHIVIAVVAALLVAALRVFGARRPPDPRGWRHIRPGLTYQLGIGLGIGLTLFMAYIWLWVGSSRPDGEAQMRILFWLIIAFGCGTLITLIQLGQVMRAAIRWRGDSIVWRAGRGAVETRKLSQIASVQRRIMGAVIAHFDDGTRLRIDPHAANAGALIALIETQTRCEH